MIFVLNNICIDSVHSEWSNIHCVQLIVYLEYIINIVLIPVLKYWWRGANNTAVVIKGDIITLCFASSVVMDKMQHYGISNALAMEIPQSCTGPCNGKEFQSVKELWNLFCGDSGDNTKIWSPFIGTEDTTCSLASRDSMQIDFWWFLHF